MDLVRIFAIFFIVLLHLVQNNIGLNDVLTEKRLGIYSFAPMAFANCITIIGVNLFFLLSGYFKIKPKISKALKLIFKVYVYWIIGTFLAWAIGIQKFTNAWELIKFCAIGISKYWFIIVYILLMLVAPLLNNFIEAIASDGKTKYFIAVTIILFVVAGFVADFFYPYFGTGNGFLPLWAWIVYCYGRLIKIYENKINIKYAGIWWALVTVLNFGIIMLVYCLLKNGALAIHFYSYNSPLVFCCSILFFIMFLKSNICGKPVNTVAKTAPYVLTVYLLHSNNPIVSPYRAALINLVEPLWAKFLLLIPNALILFALGILVDFVYEISIGKLIGKLCLKIEQTCMKIFAKKVI